VNIHRRTLPATLIVTRYTTVIHSFIMRSTIILGLSSIASGAVIDRRDPVPAGYVAAPYYPAPHGGWVSDWSESYRKASLLVSNMTLAEKTNITAGSGIFMGRCVGNTGSALRVGIPQLWYVP
jgi:beta-glucosidase